MRMQREPLDITGKYRYSKWMFIRNTYGELQNTTIPSWTEWFDESVFGAIKGRSPLTQEFRFKDVRAEVLFLSLDKPDDVKKLRGAQVTGVFFNESKFIYQGLINDAISRTGRYPSLRNVYRTGILKWKDDPRRFNDGGFQPHECRLTFMLSKDNPSPIFVDNFFIVYKKGKINLQVAYGDQRLVTIWHNKLGEITDIKGDCIFSDIYAKDLVVKDWIGKKMMLNDIILAGGLAWRGSIDDTNPPSERSWRFDFEKNKKPYGWSFYNFPSGLSKEADWLQYVSLGPGYYKRMVETQPKDWVDVYVHGKYGSVMDGQAVFRHEWKSDIHIEEDYTPVSDQPIVIGMDFGLTPCAVFGQKDEDDVWHIFDEFVTEGTTIADFGSSLNARLRHDYAVSLQGITAHGDPAGNNHNDAMHTAFMTLRQCGIIASPAPTNDPRVRMDVVKSVLNQRRFFVSKRCITLLDGFEGGYKYKQINAAGSDTPVFAQVPDKRGNSGRYSHSQDALQYLLLGGGELARIQFGRSLSSKPSVVMPAKSWDPLEEDYNIDMMTTI